MGKGPNRDGELNNSDKVISQVWIAKGKSKTTKSILVGAFWSVLNVIAA